MSQSGNRYMENMAYEYGRKWEKIWKIWNMSGSVNIWRDAVVSANIVLLSPLYIFTKSNKHCPPTLHFDKIE